MTLIIRPLEPEDHPGWDSLFAGYAAFYQVNQTPEMRARVWGWLMDPGHSTKGLIAVRDGAAVGLAHYRPYTRPLAASVGGYLDDLFVAPEARGTGVAGALIATLTGIARDEGWTVLRWITAEDNRTAQALYDRVAQRTGWVTYDIPL